MIRSRWFPLALALSQVALYALCVAYDYATVTSKLDVREFILRDLSRPWLDLPGWCGAWVSYTPGFTAVTGLDAPAFWSAMVVHTLLTGKASCVDNFGGPRGQLLLLPFVLAIWWWLGASLRRLAAGRRLTPLASRWSRQALTVSAFLLCTLSVLLLLMALISPFLGGFGPALRALGLGGWFGCWAYLAKERTG